MGAAAPTRPGHLNMQNLKYLRFVDPEDETKIVQIALVDTGSVTGDDVPIYALGVGSGSGVLTPGLPTTLPANPSYALTGGAAEQLPAQDFVAGVVLKNRNSNSNSIWIGGDNSVAPNNGFELQPGESVPIPVANLDLIWVYGTASEVLDWIGG